MLELFRRLHADGQTIVMVTHSDEVAAGASRIVHMRDGRIEDGEIETSSAGVGDAEAAVHQAETEVDRPATPTPSAGEATELVSPADGRA